MDSFLDHGGTAHCSCADPVAGREAHQVARYCSRRVPYEPGVRQDPALTNSRRSFLVDFQRANGTTLDQLRQGMFAAIEALAELAAADCWVNESRELPLEDSLDQFPLHETGIHRRRRYSRISLSGMGVVLPVVVVCIFSLNVPCDDNDDEEELEFYNKIRICVIWY